MTVRLPDHLDLLAAAPDGIRKLRGLILELAVRGKLVPQDADDEPASELLKRIAKERARLEAEGICKKSKATPSGDGAKMSFDLPRTWQWVRFEEIAQHNSGKTLDRGRNSGEPRPYITTSNLYWGRFELDSVRQMLINDDELPRCTARKNDLLICEGGEAGRAAVWPHDYEVCFQNHVHRARLFGGINPYFAYRFFEKLNASGEIDLYRKGVGIFNMSGKALASIPFPIPPLPEQHRIVAKVDGLMALCDRLEAEQGDAGAAHARLVATLLGTLTQSADAAELAANWQRLAEHFDTLFTTESSLDALKQTILQLAVMGKLVPQDPNDEPTSELLKRIAKERARLESEGACKSILLSPPVAEGELPFSAPEEWTWRRLDALLAISGGVTLGRKLADCNVVSRPYLRVANVQRGKLLLDHMKSLEVPVVELAKYRLQTGDLLITEGGDWDKVGRTAIWRGEIPECLHQNHVFRARPLSAEWCSRWTEMYLNAAPARTYFAASSKQTTNLASINMTQLKSCPFPVPPLPEQHRIVAKVDELMALCDRLTASLAESRRQQERLTTTLIESALQAA